MNSDTECISNSISEELIMGKRPKILVVGSFVMDQIVTTRVFPQEGETVLGKTFHKAPGGKGANQAVQMARLGADVTMIGKLGKDSNGEELLDVCKKAGIDTGKVLFDETEASGCAMIILELIPGGSTRNRIIVIPGSNMTIKPEEIAFLEDEIEQYDLVLLQHEIPMEVNEKVASYAHAKGVPVMLNPAPAAQLSKEFIANLTYISPNEHEAAAMTGIKIHRDKGVFNLEEAKVAALVLRGFGVDNVVITLGESGVLMDTPQGMIYKPSVPDVNVVDPTAAGDSFVGAFCTRICMGDSFGEALTFANHTAALTVSKMGAMPSLPHLDEVEEYIRSKKD